MTKNAQVARWQWVFSDSLCLGGCSLAHVEWYLWLGGEPWEPTLRAPLVPRQARGMEPKGGGRLMANKTDWVAPGRAGKSQMPWR